MQRVVAKVTRFQKEFRRKKSFAASFNSKCHVKQPGHRRSKTTPKSLVPISDRSIWELCCNGLLTPGQIERRLINSGTSWSARSISKRSLYLIEAALLRFS